VTVRYLLDTNIVSDIVRHPRGRVASRIAAVGDAAIATSVVVAAELRYGAAKSGSAPLAARVEAILGVLPVLSIEPGVDRVHGGLRAALERRGLPIGGNDLLIAAHALSADLTLVTDNLCALGRVDGLRVVNWLRETP